MFNLIIYLCAVPTIIINNIIRTDIRMKSVVYSKVHPNPAFKELVKENDRVGARTLSIKSPSSSSFLGRKSSKSSSPQS